MYKKVACFIFSGCLVFLLSFISLADDFETSDVSKMEYGGTELGQNDFLGSQDNVGNSYVDNENIQNSIESSPDSIEFTGESSVESIEGFLESSQAVPLENGGLSDENKLMASESEEIMETSLEDEKTVPDIETAVPNTLDGSELKENLVGFQGSPEAFSDMGTEDISSPELYVAVLECRGFLESCMYLLSVDTALFSILIGCLCCSIFSKFLRWWR